MKKSELEEKISKIGLGEVEIGIVEVFIDK